MNAISEYLPAEAGAKAVRRRGRTAGSGVPALPDRLPPHSAEAERGVIGCAVGSPQECMGLCVERMKRAEWFYDLRHQTIWHVLREMYDKQEAIDTITVRQRLKDRGVLEEVGGDAYLAGAVDGLPSAFNLPAYLDTLKEKWLLRETLRVCGEAVADIYEEQGQGAEARVQGIEARISALTESASEPKEEHIKAVTLRVIQSIEERHYKRGSAQLRGLPTGPAGNYLDKMLGGIRETYYMLLAGRPGSGKTSYAMNLVEHLALDYAWTEEVDEAGAKQARKKGMAVQEYGQNPESRIQNPEDGAQAGGAAAPPDQGKKYFVERRGVPVCVFSIEMDADCLVERLLFGRAGVDVAQFNQGYGHADDTQKLTVAVGHLAKSNIYIDASPEQTMGMIAAKARRMARQYGIKLFVLDYVQLVEQEGGNGFDRQKELTKISRKIMALKKQLKVPWLVLAQMNRNIETAERERKPVLSDLKDCGALEQDCDLAIFTYKTPRKDLERAPDDGESDGEILERVAGGWPWSQRPYRVDLVVPKYRFGPTGEAKMVFCKNLCRFEDWHLWKVKHGVEQLKAGETAKGLGLPSNDELGMDQ